MNMKLTVCLYGVGLALSISACKPKTDMDNFAAAATEPAAAVVSTTSSMEKSPMNVPSNKVQQANGKLDSGGKTSLRAGDLDFEIEATSCRKETDLIQFCAGKTRISVHGDGRGFEQTLEVPSFYFDSANSVYRGPLDASYKIRGHSIVISDVNEDGKEDILIWTGKEGAYGGPSYDVYLFEASSGNYVHSADFSELTQGYNGLFFVEQGRIKAVSSEGCCLHVQDTFEVKGNKPVLVERITEDTSNPDAPKKTVERLLNGELKEVRN